MDTRWLVALVGLAISIAISVLAWALFGTLLLFLFIPFIPLFALKWPRQTSTARKRCPRCGFETTQPSFKFCPRDATRLEDVDNTTW